MVTRADLQVPKGVYYKYQIDQIVQSRLQRQMVTVNTPKKNSATLETRKDRLGLFFKSRLRVRIFFKINVASFGSYLRATFRRINLGSESTSSASS